MIQRPREKTGIQGLLSRNPIVAILGPRQVGKTTLARQAAKSRKPIHWFDLEDTAHLARLQEPLAALRPLKGLIVLDEIQRRPEIFPALRVLADEPRSNRKFLLLGSASPSLLKQSSESLAGRISYHVLGGFGPSEAGPRHMDRLWLRGGFPRSFLSPSDAASFQWRRDFISTFLERDLPQLQPGIPSTTLRRFWTMLAHYHGQVWNASELARSFGVSDMTVRRYLDLLSGSFMVRQLAPWSENIGKRVVKSPKIHFLDSGLFHSLSGIEDMKQLLEHPRVGASWEGFLLDCILRGLEARPEEAFFWATHTGAELDLLVVKGRTRLGFEIKRTSEPSVTPSMKSALKDLKLDRLFVVHSGQGDYPLADRVEALSSSSITRKIKPLR